MTIRFCPGCGNSGGLRFKSNVDSSKINETSFSSRKAPEFMHHDLHECATCKTLYTPFVADSDLLKAYESAPLHATQESFAAASTYRGLIARELSTHPLSVLDVGCGDGAFLSQMIDGGSEIAHGVEPSMDAAKQNTDNRVTILAKTLNEIPANHLYDAVCLFQTIEHVSQPKELVELMVSHLAKDGSLYLVCHDRFSLVNRLLGRRSPIFDIEHLQLYTRHGIRHLLEASGLQIRTLKRFSNHYPLTYALQLAFPKLKTPDWLSNISIPVPAGNLFIRATHSPKL